MKNRRLHVFWSGRVQGVGFRYTAESAALEIRLTGWVRNLPDGRVEVVAAGEEPRLAKLEVHLRTGPRLARVGHVEKLDIPHEDVSLNLFEIR